MPSPSRPTPPRLASNRRYTPTFCFRLRSGVIALCPRDWERFRFPRVCCESEMTHAIQGLRTCCDTKTYAGNRAIGGGDVQALMGSAEAALERNSDGICHRVRKVFAISTN